MKENKMNMVISVIIFLAVIAFFVFITINNKDDMIKDENIGVEKNVAVGTVVKIGDVVSVNYTGKLDNGTVFDSNVDPAFQHVQPFEFTVGVGQVIPGWDKAFIGMKVGDKKTLVIPPEDAYGSVGVGEVIPPNATLTFEVELLAIKNSLQ